ncbi:hypothetical protein F4859DRAFT_238004 [Xylaria cf. heliscus]|nr:hypothetical protein F4859DRAFT_238004 [Xylaria cf. heliscus]
METSAPKRRKTSPTTSVQINEPSSSASSDSATRRSSRLNPQSSASPENTSLARSFSEILHQRTSSRGSQFDEEVLSVPAASELNSPTSHQGSENDLVTAQLELESETSQLQRDDGDKNSSATVQRPRSPVRRAGGGLSMRPRRTPTKPFARPLPPPSMEEEELIDPFKGRRLRRSPPPGVLPQIEPEEPELPPTPTQRGLSDPSSVVTSPAGIHNTPSKRPRKSKALAAKMNSSPLKRLPLRPPEPGPQTVEEPALLREEPRRKRRKRIPHPARQVPEPDPLADKKALRDSLLAEVAQLQDDLRVVSRENERLHRTQRESRRRTADLVLPDAEEQTRLLDVLQRHALPPEKEAPPDPNRDWLEAAMNPIAFLPFGNAALAPPLILPGTAKEQGEEKEPPVSHHPVSMTADEELPYLQLFTPLTFTSTITTLQQEGPETDSSPLLQQHAISVASSPPGLFAARVDMTVDTKTLSIAELAVPRLDPVAIPELGPFIDGILRGEGNSALTKNISVITWAMGEWVRLATRRARFWHAVTRELGSPERVLRCAERMRRRTRRGRGQHAVDDEDEDAEDETEKKAPSKADVIALMGRTSFDLDLPAGDDGEEHEEEVTARIHWRVEFDWTGEARSRIWLLLSAPAKWHARDEKKSLAGLPDMFDKLLADRKDPLEAVKIAVALIIGDGPRS